MYDVTFSFFSAFRGPLKLVNPDFDVEFDDKKNFIFKFFIFSKFVE